MLRWFGACQAKYGECFTFSMPSWGRVVVINVPQWLEIMRKGDNITFGKGEAALSIFREFPGYSAFGTEGKSWRLTRRVQLPVYQLKSANDHVVQSLANILPTAKTLLHAAGKQSLVIDWNHFAGRLALDIFCKSALSLDAKLLTDDPQCLSTPAPLMDSVAALNKVSGK
ncbi:hypothetical protein ONZ45_g8459 [Pleurotus djamor]|nr:hypothetical protein ONZ45_g8459 [Pleurotus djamor]